MTTQITVSDDECWVCGNKFTDDDKKTIHHTLPKNLNPVKNIMVPIHESCHNKINSVDFNSLVSFTFKINKDMERVRSEVTSLNNLLTNFRILEIKKKV